jgi:hypothetical protein
MNQVSSLECFGARLRRYLLVEGGLQLNETSLPKTGDKVRPGMPQDQTQNRSALQDWFREFNALALELFSLQFAHNAAYRTFCENREVSPASLRDWREIPAVPATAFKELELSCIPEGQRTKVFFSSGTTEDRPSRHFHNEASLQIYEASLLAGFNRHFPGEAFPTRSSCNSPAPQLDDARHSLAGEVLALTPPPKQAPHSSLVHMFQTLRRRLSFRGFSFTGLIGKDGAWRLDDSRTTELLQAAIDRQEPVVLLGTAFSYVHLLDRMAERDLKFQLPERSRLLETGGYKGRSRSLPKSELHKLITRRLGIPCSHIVCEYGMSELSSQAYDRTALPEAALPDEAPAQGWHAAKPRPFHFPPWVRVQIISPETGREVQEGETGLIRVFDLANVYSVMAVQTEDLGVRRGPGFELIGRAALAEARGCSLMVSQK